MKEEHPAEAQFSIGNAPPHTYPAVFRGFNYGMEWVDETRES
jgi:hypothetical protein